jgi:hypothetical protein
MSLAIHRHAEESCFPIREKMTFVQAAISEPLASAATASNNPSPMTGAQGRHSRMRTDRSERTAAAKARGAWRSM